MATSPVQLSFFAASCFVISLESQEIKYGQVTSHTDTTCRTSCTAAVFSPDGRMLAVTTADAVVIHNTDNAKQILSLPVPGAVATAFTPLGNYLQIFQTPTGNQRNLSLWDLRTGSVSFQLFQKTASKTNWPLIQFSEDETVACHLVTNEVHLYDGTDFGKGITDKLRQSDIGGMQLASGNPKYIATYVPEKKGAPAKACIFDCTQLNMGLPTARRSFYRSTSAKLLWNKSSTGLLVLAHSDVDKTNQSYYGESRLHFLTCDGKHEGSVPLKKDGPIHDVNWSPSGREFLVVYGFMPAQATLFDVQCRPLFDFGSGPYNTIRWNPQGSFICLAGFGNLPGDMAFWDRHNLKLIGSTRSGLSVTCEWSPDGEVFMTATTAPRLQVDNGIKFFRYNGTLYHEKKFATLYQAEWQPGPKELYMDLSQSTRNVIAAKNQDKHPVPAGKPEAYRPPNAKDSAAVAAQLFGEDTKAGVHGGGLSKSALKNQKRRANKQKEPAQTGVDKAQGASQAGSTIASEGIVMGEADVVERASCPGVNEVAKKIRALQKKLRQVQEVKAKSSEPGGKMLTTAQQGKLLQEAALKAEIQELEAQQSK